MRLTKLARQAYLSYFSHPSGDRWLYRLIRRHGVASIVEVGVGAGARASRMVETALSCPQVGTVRYTGIDLFEARPHDRPGMTIKQAHRTLQFRGAKVQLIPGDPFTALSRMANTLAGMDLMVIGADQDRESLAWAWFYVPRMLHERSLVCLEQSGDRGRQGGYQLLSRSEVDALAAATHGVWQRVA